MTYQAGPDEVLRWRTVAEFTVTGDGVTLACGDPCYGGLDPLPGALAAGSWAWDVRDVDTSGQPTPSPHEVRARRTATAASPDAWTWWDDYGQPNPALFPPRFGTVGASQSRGVDSGRMRFTVRSATDTTHFDGGAAATPGDTVEVDRDGRTLETSTGFGDGLYGVATRVVDGRIVEARMEFVAPHPGWLTARRFTGLLPGAFPGADVSGRVGLLIQRHAYTAYTQPTWHDEHDPNQTVDRSYDTVLAVLAPDAGLRFNARHRLTSLPAGVDVSALVVAADRAAVDRVASLWNRADGHAQEELTRSVNVHQVTPGEPVGSIVDATDTLLTVWLRDAE